MEDLAIIIAMLAALAAGAILGAVGVLSAIAYAIHGAAKPVQAHAMSHPGLVEPLAGPRSAHDAMLEHEREAADALLGLQEGRRAAANDAAWRPKGAPCLPCQKARAALRRAKTAFFGP